LWFGKPWRGPSNLSTWIIKDSPSDRGNFL
jgi:hypothetical protein